MVLRLFRPNRRLHPSRRRDERGAFLVLAVFVLIAMLAMSAIAVDLSNARQQRRQSQATADAAALAAAQDLPDPAKVVTTVKSYVLKNFSVPASAWIGCTDPDRLSSQPDGANSNQCISIDESFSRVRVRVPDKNVKTYFAGMVGISDLPVNADAIAEATLKRDDRIIPATVAASTGSGLTCIENGGANVAPCNKATTGNFGSFDAPRLNIYKPTANEDPDSLIINYSMGVDHVLSIYGTGSPRVCDDKKNNGTTSPCTTTNTTSGLDTNHLLPYTGNVVPPLTSGVIDDASISTDQGTKTFCGRLKRPDLTDANLTETNPENCLHWTNAPGPGPRISVLGDWLNGRQIAYWMKPEFRTLFYPGLNPTTTPVGVPGSASVWDTGNTKLDCFLSTYRFDYGGSYSKGHASQTEFFIDPNSTLNTSTADGTEFTLAQAKTFLINTCKLDATTINAKLASLTDTADFWPMFDKGMVADPRFGMIPVVKSFNSGGSNAMQIVRFWGTFINGLYPNGGNKNLIAIDAWTFEPALIQTESGIADLQFGYQTKEPKVRLVE